MEEEKTKDQLKFIASMFKMLLKEADTIMGSESIQTIFRLIGERQGKEVEKRIKEKFNVEKWTSEEFADKFVKDVLDPALGEGQSEVEIKGDEMIVTVNVCPFQRAGIDISSKFFCTYTEGLIDTAAKEALKNTEFKTEELQSSGTECCKFKIKLRE
jgi:predicted hydrocarbon binding protein